MQKKNIPERISDGGFSAPFSASALMACYCLPAKAGELSSDEDLGRHPQRI